MIEVSEEQVLHFRAIRGHTIGPGAKDVTNAARAILGAQAQQLGTGVLALAQRTKGRPTAAAIEAMLFGEKRRLVRTWGQRGTMHIYSAADWRSVIAAWQQWSPTQRRGPMPPDGALKKGLEILVRRGAATRRDILDVVPASYLRALEKAHGEYLETPEMARKFGAGRILYGLCLRGDACVGLKVGSQQAYATRTAWFEKLDWPALDGFETACDLTRRYLAMNGPATDKDVAHYFGAKRKDAASWLEALAGETEDVTCGDREGLVILKKDVRTLRKEPPAKWPVRLMPQWDTYLMGHADKSWTVPEAADRKIVWRGSAVVAAAVLHRGRVVAEWNHTASKGTLEVRIKPLTPWKKKYLTEVKREAAQVAAHLGLAGAAVR